MVQARKTYVALQSRRAGITSCEGALLVECLLAELLEKREYVIKYSGMGCIDFQNRRPYLLLSQSNLSSSFFFQALS
jgi:hypothetical protein